MARAVSSTACRPDMLVCAAACADAMTSWARLPICVPEWVISSTVAAVSCTAASCSSTEAACSWVEARISAAAAFRFSVASRLCRASCRKPVDHGVEGRAEMPDLVLARHRHLAAELSASDTLDEAHEGAERAGDGRAQGIGDHDAQDSGTGQGQDDRHPALLVDLADPPLPDGDRFAEDAAGLCEIAAPGFAAAVQCALAWQSPRRDRCSEGLRTAARWSSAIGAGRCLPCSAIRRSAARRRPAAT